MPVIQSNLYVIYKPKRLGIYLSRKDIRTEPIRNKTKTSLAADENPQELETILTIKSEIQQAESKGKYHMQKRKQLLNFRPKSSAKPFPVINVSVLLTMFLFLLPLKINIT